jgi:hypothetical protein
MLHACHDCSLKAVVVSVSSYGLPTGLPPALARELVASVGAEHLARLPAEGLAALLELATVGQLASDAPVVKRCQRVMLAAVPKARWARLQGINDCSCMLLRSTGRCAVSVLLFPEETNILAGPVDAVPARCGWRSLPAAGWAVATPRSKPQWPLALPACKQGTSSSSRTSTCCCLS